MSDEESVTSVRRTRSRKAVKTPVKAAKTPTTRRTRKKVVEVEVSEDDAHESQGEEKLDEIMEEQKDELNIEALKSTVKEEMSKISAQINEEKLLNEDEDEQEDGEDVKSTVQEEMSKTSAEIDEEKLLQDDQDEQEEDKDDEPLAVMAQPVEASNGDENVELPEKANPMEVDSDDEPLVTKQTEESSEEEKVEEEEEPAKKETEEKVEEKKEPAKEETEEKVEEKKEPAKEETEEEEKVESTAEAMEECTEETEKDGKPLEKNEKSMEEVEEELLEEKAEEKVAMETNNEETQKSMEGVEKKLLEEKVEEKEAMETNNEETPKSMEQVEKQLFEEKVKEKVEEKEAMETNNEEVEKKVLEEKAEEKEAMETNNEETEKTDAKPESENGLDNLSDDADMTDMTEVTKQNGDPDAENISEDELPEVPVAKVPETEEVSDEELPGPKRAELPADTEVVSEDELPTSSTTKKEGTKRKLDEGDYDPGSPTSENEAPTKKAALEASPEKEKEEKPAKPKKLPELDKYWKAVNDDPTDFTGWTYLLQYVDQENDMEAAREAYDAFLSHYPYCYGYWRKYADYEKRKGNKKKCEEVFERGLKSIPLSVDLWIHYLTYVKSSKQDDEEYVRSQFERALTACGLEFRSDRLWDSYIKWETEAKRLQQVTAIYDRLLATPTQGYTSHFDNFQEHIASNSPNKVVEVDEFLALRKEVRHMLKHDNPEPNPDSDAPPGDDDSAKTISSDEETKSIRERIVSIRRKIHKNTVSAVTARWNYEEGIKRPYFHVKPLERCQLKNWQDYLDYEIEQGDKTRAIVLFERCLIACALYEEFWLKFVHYLEKLKDADLQLKIRDVYERACTIHHLKKPNLHLQWAMFEESVANYNRAAEILVNLEKSVPNVLQVAYRRINLERRRKDHEKCVQLYEHYINNSKNKVISSNISIKYSRFCFKVLKDIEKAQETLKTAITKDQNNPRLYLQLIDLTLQKEEVTESEVIALIDSFLDKESTDADQKVLFAQRKLEYLEDFGAEIQSVQLAYDQYQKLIKLSKENIKKKESKSADSTASTKKEKGAAQTSTTSSYGYNYGTSSSTASYPYSGSQQGQYNYSQYGQGDQYQYQNWQYPQGGYGNYNQWGSYSGGYGY